MKKTISNAKSVHGDRSFADISHKFGKNIYGTGKGKIREAVLVNDLRAFCEVETQKPLSVLDIGGGQGQLALYLAQQGHHVTLLDISDEMIEVARTRAKEADLLAQFSFIHAPLQSLQDHNKQYDLVLCHAVFEWLEAPYDALAMFKKLLLPMGTLSLMFFNADANRFANIIYGNFEYLANNLQVKKKVKLNPNKPLSPGEVIMKAADLGFKLVQKTGVRCFYDYMRDISTWDTRFDEILALELAHCHEEPYASLGRYCHLILKSK